MRIDAAACDATVREAEGVPPRPAPPILEFEPPHCSICGDETEVTTAAFHCDACGCSWPRTTAHLYPGMWDSAIAEQCPDVLEDTDGLALAQCMRTAGHKGDHIDPKEGEWFADGEES